MTKFYHIRAYVAPTLPGYDRQDRGYSEVAHDFVARDKEYRFRKRAALRDIRKKVGGRHVFKLRISVGSDWL